MRIKKRKILEGVDRKNVSAFQRIFQNAMSDLMDEFKGIGIDTDDLDFKHDLEDQMEDFLDAYFDGKEYKKAYYGESLRYTKSELMNAVQDYYGYSKKEAQNWIKNASDTAKDEVVKYFKGNAKKNFYDESLLTEKQWKHQLSNGMEIRQAIEDEDYHALRKALLSAYSEIHDMMPDEFDAKDYDDAMSEIDFLDTKPDEDAGVTAEDLEDNWNYELSDFYDLCDALDIWIPLNESLNESFEDEYNNCFVEFRDGKPSTAYDKYTDARRGMFSSKMGDSYYDMGIHDYAIKYLENGTYYEVDDDGNPIMNESLNESRNTEYLENSELGMAIRAISRAIADGKALNDDEQKVYMALRDAVAEVTDLNESLTEDAEGDALDEINDRFIGAYDNDESYDDDYEEEEVTEYDT